MHHTGAPAPGRVQDTDAWARDALAFLSDLPGVLRVGLALTEGGGRRQRFTASDRTGGHVDWCHVDAYDDVPLNTAVHTGRPVVAALDDLDERYAGFVDRQRGTGTVALAAVPIAASGQTLGGFVLFYAQPQAFDGRQRSRLAVVGTELGHRLRRAQRADGRSAITFADEPVPAGARAAVHEVAPDLAAVGAAREFLGRTLAAWSVDDQTTDTAVLCLSELVTNAVIHTHGGAEVRVVLEEGVLTTTVRDRGAGEAGAAAPDEDPLRVHGRGLQVVGALATRWGSELDRTGTSVWFVLEPS